MTQNTASILPLVLLLLIPTMITMAAGWRILVRAGYNGAWSLTLLVPLVKIIVVYLFALSLRTAPASAPTAAKVANVFD